MISLLPRISVSSKTKPVLDRSGLAFFLAAVSSCTPKFFFLQPHNVMQRQKYLYYFLKTPKYT